MLLRIRIPVKPLSLKYFWADYFLENNLLLSIQFIKNWMDVMEKKVSLASDNYTAAHPSVMQALLEANQGAAQAYGEDLWTKKAEKLIQKALGRKGKIHIVASGSGANIFALKLACQGPDAVICSDIAHINTNETGAAEAVVGCKLLPVPHENGKISPEKILRKIKAETINGKHSSFPKVLSITQSTEVGTVYTLKEIKALAKFCKEHDLLFHMDGSRLYNAAVALGAPLSELTRDLDLLSLGGTKNGLMQAEALVIFNPALQKHSEYIQKQILLLVSKARYQSAQFIPYFEDHLWKSLAEHANKQAKKIAASIEKSKKFRLSYPVETNQIFFAAPPNLIPKIQEKISCYLWNEEKGEIRFVTSWSTTDEDVKAVQAILKA
jgi:threonine aldolase